MTNLQQFAFNSQSVRVISVDGEPWFVATDVLIAIKSATKVNALKAVVSEDLGDEYVNNTPIADSLGRLQETTIIHEAAVTFLVSRSRTETGKAFNRLLHSEILPSIRKTGKYEIEQQAIAPSLPEDYEEAVAALLGQIREKKALAAANQQLEQEKQVLQFAIAEVKPKAELYDIYVSADGWLTGEQIAKQLSVSTRKMFDVLRDGKVIYSRSGRNMPCADWVSKEWATMRPVRCHDEIVRSNLVFSHKAIMQIFDLLQDKGLIPKNRDYQLRFELDEPRQLKMA